MEQENNKKLKLGFFIDTFFPMVDGVVMVVDNYVRRLSKKYDVTVFTTKPRKKGFDDNSLPYKVVRCKRIPIPTLDYDLPLPKLSGKFKKTIKNGEFDLIHIHSPFGVGKMGLQYAKKHNIPVVSTLHSQFYKDFLRETHNIKWLSKSLLKKVIKVFDKCDECWAVNANVAEIYFKEYGLKVYPKVHNNGTDLMPVNDIDFNDLKQKYGILEDEKVCLFVGRLTYLKNIHFIAESLKICKEKGLKFKMLFVGSGPDESKIKSLVKDLDLDNEVLFLGRITDRNELSKIYAMSDLFLFPSLYDCSSLVQIEASSQKTPTLFLAESATACSVSDNVNGYLSSNLVNDYADKIIEIFKDNQVFKKVCDNAFNDLYVSWDDAVIKAENNYLNLIKKFKENK